MPLASASPDFPSHFGWNYLTESVVVIVLVFFGCLYCCFKVITNKFVAEDSVNCFSKGNIDT